MSPNAQYDSLTSGKSFGAPLSGPLSRALLISATLSERQACQFLNKLLCPMSDTIVKLRITYIYCCKLAHYFLTLNFCQEVEYHSCEFRSRYVLIRFKRTVRISFEQALACCKFDCPCSPVSISQITIWTCRLSSIAFIGSKQLSKDYRRFSSCYISFRPEASIRISS